MARESQWLGVVAIVGLLVVLMLGYWAWDYFSADPLKRPLPYNAYVVYERHWAVPRVSIRYLKVGTMSEPDFGKYCKRLGLTPHYPDREYTGGLSWEVIAEGKDEDWNPLFDLRYLPGRDLTHPDDILAANEYVITTFLFI